mmetsp:Transcript_29737/g.41352  ORF Transcript_29737/g.41352 Transcript_29737/m.41352 type:complete len:222 (-) Transcript_29737:164-829(-)
MSLILLPILSRTSSCLPAAISIMSVMSSWLPMMSTWSLDPGPLLARGSVIVIEGLCKYSRQTTGVSFGLRGEGAELSTSSPLLRLPLFSLLLHPFAHIKPMLRSGTDPSPSTYRMPFRTLYCCPCLLMFVLIAKLPSWRRAQFVFAIFGLVDFSASPSACAASQLSLSVVTHTSCCGCCFSCAVEDEGGPSSPRSLAFAEREDDDFGDDDDDDDDDDDAFS